MSEYIPGIYNYCDRWCERCPLSSQCMIYAEDQAGNKSFNDEGNTAFWKKIEEHLSRTMALIRQKIEESGYDWETFVKEAKAAPDKDIQYTGEQRLLDFCGKKYSMFVRQWVENNSSLLQEKRMEFKSAVRLNLYDSENSEIEFYEALEVIQWYKFFITAKLKRAINGLHDEWSLKEFPVQNDANGTAKVALMAVDRSLVAWQTLYNLLPEMHNDIIEALRLLAKIRDEILEQFKEVNEFVRPGFDSIP